MKLLHDVLDARRLVLSDACVRSSLVSRGAPQGFGIAASNCDEGGSWLTCIDATYPSIRFFIVGDGSVAVDVVSGSLVIPAGVAVAGGDWSPTPVMLTSSAVLAAPSGGTVQVSLRLTALSGSPQSMTCSSTPGIEDDRGWRSWRRIDPAVRLGRTSSADS